MYYSREQEVLTNEYTFCPKACISPLTRQCLLVFNASGMPVANNLVFSVLLLQEHIGERVFDVFDTNVVWLIWEGLEV